MATLQRTIPFKSRKRTLIASKRGKIDENEDILNTLEVKKDKALKRRKELKSIEINENDTCSAAKIVRRNTSESTGEEHQSTNSSQMKPLTSREKEIEFIEAFLMEHLESEKSASLYVSGQPGTGKSASLSYILQLPQIQKNYKQVYINCTMMKTAASIYCRICEELQLQTKGSSEKACLTAIEKYLTKKHRMILLVLDEIDQLESKRQAVLYTVFEWAALPASRVVLVGVANALDLTERALPRLQARFSLRPATLHFAPYTKEQIVQIFTEVLATEDRTNVFSPVALQMLAAKIAAVSGDMRRALDTGRRAVQLAARAGLPAPRPAVAPPAPRSRAPVELSQVLQVLAEVWGSARLAAGDALPIQQKLILCSLMLMLTRGKNKDVVMGKLYDVYKKVACARNIAPLDMCEVSSACALLEARGALLVAAAPAPRASPAPRARRVRLLWDEAELAAALRDKPLLSAILNDVGCLS